MTTNRQKKRALAIASLLLGLLAFFEFVHYRRLARQVSIVGAADSETNRPQKSAPPTNVTANANSAGQRPFSKVDLAKSRAAYDDLIAALSRLAHAKSYKRVARTRNADGTSTLRISVYKQSPNGTDLYREDVDVVDSTSGKLLKRLSDEFTNDQGSFFVPHQAGSPQTAYLLTNAIEPEVSYRQTLLAAVSADPSSFSDSAMLNYTESTITAEDGSLETVINITTTNPSQANGGISAPQSTVADIQYRINNVTGNITSQAFYDSSGNVISSAEFPTTELNPTLADSLFTVPRSLPVVPVATKVEAMQTASSYK